MTKKWKENGFLEIIRGWHNRKRRIEKMMVLKMLYSKILLVYVFLLISNVLKGQTIFGHDLLMQGADSLIVVSKSPMSEYFSGVGKTNDIINWGQYGDRGIWEINNDSLFLIDVGVSPFLRKRMDDSQLIIPIGFSDWYTGEIVVSNGYFLRRGKLFVIYSKEIQLFVEQGRVVKINNYVNVIDDANRVKRNNLYILNKYFNDVLSNCIDLKKYNVGSDSIFFLKYEFSIDETGKMKDIESVTMNIGAYKALDEAVVNCLYKTPYFEIIQKKNVPIPEYFNMTVKVAVKALELHTMLQWSMWNEFKTKPTSR